MTDLIERLQAAVGDTYRIEHELGGGGMSRVFVAQETRLDRRVVIKLLPPEMGAGVNIERFEREIRLAAKLQHPHVVPLLTAGSQDDLLYYVMPLIEGESLRGKLAREGELPVAEAVRILRDVCDALAYSHQEGVVHRDIKPDNVLLSRGHAVVTDFGVAKAVSDSSGGQSLTSMGVALGTPAYMSPEQAAANPHIDHRSDVYAVGVLAYEMLCGRPPFDGPNPQSILSAQVTQEAEPLMGRRAATPPALNDLVMRCLAKLPADRWQSADDLRQQFDAMATPSGGLTPTGSQPVVSSASEAAVRQSHPIRVAGIFGLAAVGVLALVYSLVIQLGLPYWVMVAAGALLVVGLPIMMLTGHHERRRVLARTTGHMTATPAGVERHFTWRKALVGGGIAFGALGVAAAGYMAMRLLGVGPVGTLVASGVLEDQERLILAEFTNFAPDSTLSGTVTELLRIDLAQSPVINVLEPAQVGAVLERMRRPTDTTLSPELAQEAAEREGIKAYITGEVRPVGSGLVLSARLVATGTGEALASARESADDDSQILGAVDRLSATLRERIGESLRTVRADAPLANVTTSSVEALRLYAEATRAGATGDYEAAVRMLEEAVAGDSSFAMAYRRLSAFLGNIGRFEDADSAIARGYALRDRLTDRERYLVVAMYESRINDDAEAVAAAYESVLRPYPNDLTTLNNLSSVYANQGQIEKAESLLVRAVATGNAYATHYSNLVRRQSDDLDAVERTLELFDSAYPGNPEALTGRASLAGARAEYDSAEAGLEALREALRGNPRWEENAAFGLSQLAYLRGMFEDARRFEREAFRSRVERGLMEDSVADRIEEWIGFDQEITVGIGERLVERLESRWQQNVARLPPEQRGHLFTAQQFVRVGAVARAEALIAEYVALVDMDTMPDFMQRYHREVAARVAMASGSAEDAIRFFREQREEDEDTCPLCSLFDLAYAYDSDGQSDSAIAYYRQHLETPHLYRLGWDVQVRALILRRLGELYEERGEHDRAAGYYADFVALWENGDPPFQAQVDDVRGRIARLSGERR